MRENDDEAALLLRMIDGDTWREVHTLSRRNPDNAVAVVKAQLEGRITRLFAESGEHLEERPLLPAMGTLLAAAAGDADAADQVSKEALDLFGRKLTGLLPVGFTPEGTGPLRVLVTHPRVQAVEEVQEYLGKALRLPSDAKNSVEYRGVESDSVTVVLFRSEMSLTQVPEARKVLRQWARAKDSSRPRTYCAGGSGSATGTAGWSAARRTAASSCTGCCAACGTARSTWWTATRRRRSG